VIKDPHPVLPSPALSLSEIKCKGIIVGLFLQRKVVLECSSMSSLCGQGSRGTGTWTWGLTGPELFPCIRLDEDRGQGGNKYIIK
jgi:hypothetical protein